MFSEDEIQRYSRHILLPQIGGKGQKKLAEASVLIIGAGGLGSVLSLYLCAAGVGRIGIVDADKVELSNLQRQIIYASDDVGEKKVNASRKTLLRHNKNVKIDIWDCRLTDETGSDIVPRYDVICDGSDNFPTRYSVNRLCVTHKKPLISASAQGFGGQLIHFDSQKHTGCYNCLYPQQGQVTGGNCSQSGVLGPVVGTVGALQATETLKTILGFDSFIGELLLWDALAMNFTKLSLTPDPQCGVCGK